jgi:HEAT repeat protein
LNKVTAMKRNWFLAYLVVGAVVLALAGLAGAALPVSAQGPGLPDGGHLLVDSPAQSTVAFAAAGKQVLRSSDGGESWTALGELPSIVTAMRPANHDVALLYAGTQSSGVFRSYDGGQSWQAVTDGLGLTPGAVLEVSALALDPADDSLLYAATGYWLGSTQMHFSPATLVFSLNGGATWLPLATLPLSGQRVAALSAEAGHPLTVVARDASGQAERYSASASTLVALLSATDAAPARQAAVAKALGLLGDPAATPALLASLESGDTQVASAAAGALGALGATEAVPALRDMLLAPDSVAPSAAADALAAIGTPPALDALYAALNQDPMTAARHVSMGALERLGSPAVPGLVAMAGGGDPVSQRNAVEMLGWIADPAAQDTLLAALKSGLPDVRAQAAWALGELNDPGAYQALADAAASDPNAEVRLQATHAMARMPEPPAVAAAPVQPDVADSGEPVASSGQERPTGLPGWLAAALPALRWVILALVLLGAALLPWYQNQREERRRRHN